MRTYKEVQVVVTRTEIDEEYCDRCGRGVEEVGDLIPIAVEVAPLQDGGRRDERDYCRMCLVIVAPGLVAAGSRAPLVTGNWLEPGGD